MKLSKEEKANVYKMLREKRKKLDPETFESYKEQLLENLDMKESKEALDMERENKNARKRMKMIDEMFPTKKK